MSPLAILITVLMILIVVIALILLLNRYVSLGSLPITTASVAYDRFKYGHILTWDKHSLILHGKRTLILGGEFHYWRVPDRDRWHPILRQYKNAGLNTIRIYFHWGWHSPDEGVYHFDGNRDIDYLLSLAEKIGLYVLAAPGPYLCAETQAGGIPQWLVAKRHIRIRHSLFSFFRLYDPRYSHYSAQWFQAILPIFRRHQITNNPNGCLIGLQIENESFEMFKWIPLGLHDDMRFLAKVARAEGITVPLFHNDGWEAGSFVARDEGYRVLGKPSFGFDLYSFDKYIVWCPTSSPMAAITGGAPDKSGWGEWDPANVEGALDNVEATVRRFGGGAAESPIFIPELQGGWFNHYTMKHTYDDVYTYYGETFTNLVLNSVLAQGSTLLSFYMFYGGTNWGTIGDPDVYTSYDYSASIREHGFLSGRGRQLRLGLAFARSFSDYLTQTEPLHSSDSSRHAVTICTSTPRLLHRQRIAVGNDQPVQFAFFRNFADPDSKRASVDVRWRGGDVERRLTMGTRLSWKHSYVGIAGYTAANGLFLVMSTLPIHCRTRLGNDVEIWVVQSDEKVSGSLAFKGAVDIKGTLDATVELVDGASVVSFGKSVGYASVTRAGAFDAPLYILALSEHDLYTFVPAFESASSVFPVALLWGASVLDYDVRTKTLDVERLQGEQTCIMVVSAEMGVPNEFETVTEDSSFAGFPYLYARTYPEDVPTSIEKPDFHTWQVSEIVDRANLESLSDPSSPWGDQLPWMNLPMRFGDRPAVDLIDLGFTSGHALYRHKFDLHHQPSKDLKLRINIRHRLTIYVNDHLLGGHITYSLAAYSAGSKNGPDIGVIGGMKTYTIPHTFLRTGANQIILLVESFGMNRQPFAVNDVRNPRGVLYAKLSGVGIRNSSWSVAGVDVRSLKDVFNHDGVPRVVEEEGAEREWKGFPPYDDQKERIPTIKIERYWGGFPTYFRATLDLPDAIRLIGWEGGEVEIGKLHVPLRLHVRGEATAYISVRGRNETSTLIARYYGNGDSPQHDFLIPEGLLVRKGNIFEFLVYGRDGIVIEVKEWRVRMWSGNLEKGGVSLISEGDRVQLFDL
ncbi:hypothetical protein HK097_004746 [Rhizophlyctis rosea]|uniref:Glycoside hydrolase 35 catalytic domain-containing protein n=1 Tax=Rhizophlyctis rosea TaxID=64517 RepID=A0AAD5X6D5_9FUNG|nr:hypothetical protein HK097_004746 [Rhizophlyctis rosea]